jgi:hypothetical protein
MHTAKVRLIGSRPRPKPLWRSRDEFLTDSAVFTLGAAGLYSASIVGSVPGDELLILPFLPILLMLRGNRAFNRQYFWFYVLTGGWLLGTLIADLYVGSPPVNRMKGTARVVFFAFDFMALAVVINNKTRRLLIFALSIATVLFVGSWQFQSDLSIQWKFGVSQSVAIVALLISSRFYVKRKLWICFLISLSLAGLNLAFGFRSQVAVHFVSAVLVLPFSARRRIRRVIPRRNQDKARIVGSLALACVAAFAANASIKYAANSGLFDESTQAKFQAQSQGDYGVLVGGRPETLVAIQAIRDSPFIGHGSFPFGPKYIQLRQDIQYEHGYTDTDEPEEPEFEVIPTHSHLTMAWVESGLLGGICWIYILVLTLHAVFRVSARRPGLAPLYCYLLVGFLWDILYSPFGSVNRIWAAFYILLSYNIVASPADAAAVLPFLRQKVRYLQRPVVLRPARRAIY